MEEEESKRSSHDSQPAKDGINKVIISIVLHVTHSWMHRHHYSMFKDIETK
jgi:hypothetical protein